MIKIDGSAGEGGGQVLRTALGLSLVTGKPFHIKNIRGKRKKPGLMRQHLTAVKAATEIGMAEASGAAIASQELIFKPQAVQPGSYHFAILWSCRRFCLHCLWLMARLNLPVTAAPIIPGPRPLPF